MAQHDMNMANQGFPATRADINNALQAIATNNSGTSAPSTTFANQWFYDTTNNKLFIRNEANNAFIQVAVLDQTANEWQITTGQISASDGDGLVFKTDDGTTRVTLSDGGDVTFAAGTDVLTATAGTDNVRIGENAGDSIASGGNNNVVIGKDAGTAISTGDDNTAVGHQAGGAINTGVKNTLVGALSGDALTDGDNNVAVGYTALGQETRGDRNVAVGAFALQSSNTTSDTDIYNTAVGYNAGGTISTAIQNTFVGGLCGDALNTNGGDNVAMGYQALSAEAQSSRNTAIGRGALATQNTNTNANTYNTALGAVAGFNLTTGTYNTFVGPQAGFNITSGSNNTIVGQFDGNNHSLDIRTSSNNIVLSDGSGQPRVYVTSNGCLISGGATGGYDPSPYVSLEGFFVALNDDSRIAANFGAVSTSSRTIVQICNPNGVVGSISASGSSTAFNTSSDYRLKENVVELTNATTRLKQLEPKRFNFIADADTTVDGFLAHQAQTVVPEAVTGTKDGVDKDGNPEYQGIDQSKLVPLLVATIKELETRITALENA